MGNLEPIAIARCETEPDLRGQAMPDLLSVLTAPGSPPSLATDENDRIVFWNRAAAELLGQPATEVLGRRCFDVVGGHDVYGDRFCHENCPVKTAVARQQPVPGFVLEIESEAGEQRSTHATILTVPGAQPGAFLIVHLLDPTAPPVLPRQAALPSALTPRERDILQSMAAGLQNKEVALHLGISPATVRNHVHNILDKLGVHSKLEAVSLAFRSGWVAPSSRSGPV